MTSWHQPSTPQVHFKNIVFDGKIAVADPISRTIACFVTEDEAEVLIAAGRIRPFFGRKRRVKALHWIGPKLLPRATQGMPAGIPPEELLGGKDIRCRTRYSNNKEAPDNPQNVWRLITSILAGGNALFLTPVTDCGGSRPAIKPRTKPGARTPSA